MCAPGTGRPRRPMAVTSTASTPPLMAAHALSPIVSRSVLPAWPHSIARGFRRLPAPLRRRALNAAFDRARDAFNRGDFEIVFALFQIIAKGDRPARSLKS